MSFRPSLNEKADECGWPTCDCTPLSACPGMETLCCMNEIKFGVYTCQRCAAEYIVNDGTWRQCTPEFCHDCLEYLNKQHVLVPYPEPKH